jgi:hypothetical protein
MLVRRKLATLCSILGAQWLALSVPAIEVTQPAAAAHGYPGLYDINGKKLAESEFRQWIENNRLHVVITHRFSAGEVYEEHAQFRQQPELIQEQWSWKESKHGRSQREFAVDLLTGIASAHMSQDQKDVAKKINIDPGRTFAGFGFSLALSNLRKRLLSGEKVQLKAVGFSLFPTLGPASGNGDNFSRRGRPHKNVRTLGERRSVHHSSGNSIHCEFVR